MFCALVISGDQWSPALTIGKVLVSVYSLFTNPHLDGVCKRGNLHAASLYKKDIEEYNSIAREWTKKYAC